MTKITVEELLPGKKAGVGRRKRRSVSIDQSTLLGKGGEKVVHIDPDYPLEKAIAIYLDPTAGRAAKVKAFLESGITWPQEIAAPVAAALDSGDRLVGFGMRQIDRRHVRWRELFDPNFCDNHRINLQVVARLGIAICQQLNGIHLNGFSVGDLNDGAVMFDTVTHDLAWVDVDSWNLPQHPCIAGTQLYLVPTLYNVDLSSGQHFEPWMDWYAMTVLLFRALLRKHPFKAGTHPQFPGVLQRAHHGLTVLDAAVNTSKLRDFYPDLLSDELADRLLKHLKMEVREPFPQDLLQAYHDELAECPNCKRWYPTSRPHCPVCTEVTRVDLSKMIGVEIIDLIESSGRIVYVQIDQQRVYALAEENGELVLYRKDASRTAERVALALRYEPNMRFAMFRGHLVICVDQGAEASGALYVLEVAADAAQMVAQTTTEVFTGHRPMFAASRRFLYRIAGNMLLREERFGPQLLSRPVTQIFRNQCWFVVDPNPGLEHEVIFGVNRDITAEHWFVVLGDREGKVWQRHDTAVPNLARGESLRDLSVRFDNRQVLVIRKTSYRGTERVHLETVNAASGEITTSEVVDLSAQPQWEHIHGKALSAGRVMHPTDDGIVSEMLSTHALQTLGGTAPVVSSNDRLFRYGQGILVMRYSKVSLITKR